MFVVIQFKFFLFRLKQYLVHLFYNGYTHFIQFYTGFGRKLAACMKQTIQHFN